MSSSTSGLPAVRAIRTVGQPARAGLFVGEALGFEAVRGRIFGFLELPAGSASCSSTCAVCSSATGYAA